MKKIAFLLLLFSCTNKPAPEATESIFVNYLSTPELKAEILEEKKERNMTYADSAVLSWVEYKTFEDNSSEEDNAILFEKVDKYKAEPNKVLGEYWYVKYKLDGVEIEGYFTKYNGEVIDMFSPKDYKILTTQSNQLVK